MKKINVLDIHRHISSMPISYITTIIPRDQPMFDIGYVLPDKYEPFISWEIYHRTKHLLIYIDKSGEMILSKDKYKC